MTTYDREVRSRSLIGRRRVLLGALVIAVAVAVVAVALVSASSPGPIHTDGARISRLTIDSPSCTTRWDWRS